MTNAPTEREGEGLWAKLRRRKVVQWGLAYAAGAWAILQVLGFAVDAFHWPDAVKPIAMLALAAGLPIALTLAWYHGDRGEQRVSRVELTVLTLLLLLGGGLLWRYERADETATMAAKPSTQTAAPVSAPAVATDRSIAVLPFVDMSATKDKEYFADGISEELLNLLAKVPQLRVIARTSSFSFKGKEVDIAEIAKRLNVANVLEGSVRASGEKVRITAQLIRASDSSHLWSETYDRKMTDVFELQDDIAAAVVSQLKVTLLGTAPSARKTDPKAYALYLQGRELQNQYSRQSLEQAIALFQRAVAIDPSYAPGWVSLSLAYLGQVDLIALTPARGLELAGEAQGKALAADPAYAPAYSAMALWETVVERKYDAAARHVDRALALEPTNLDAIDIAAVLARRLGRLNLAVALGEYIVARDPVNANSYGDLALAYGYSGQLDKAITAWGTVLSLTPDAGWTHAHLGDLFLQKGDANAALAEYQKEPVECARMVGVATALHALGRKADADAARAEMMKNCTDRKPFGVARALARLGDADGAFAMLDKAADIDDMDLGAVAIQPAFTGMHKDPRWLPLLRRVGLAPEQLAAIKFDVRLPN